MNWTTSCGRLHYYTKLLRCNYDHDGKTCTNEQNGILRWFCESQYKTQKHVKLNFFMKMLDLSYLYMNNYVTTAVKAISIKLMFF